MISEQSQIIIKQFLQQWWESLRWQARETMLGTELPIHTQDELFESGFGGVLRQMAAAAEGKLRRSEENIGETYECCQQMAEWMFARPGMPSTYHIPEEFWGTPIGNLTLRAYLWSADDELITVSDAADLSGHSASALSQMADRKKITRYTDPTESNPQHATRYKRSEIKRLPPRRNK